MARIMTDISVEEYRRKARGYVSRIVPNMKSKDMVDRAYALYLRRFFFGAGGEISYTYAGRTWKWREQRRELPLSKEDYIKYG